MPGFEVFQRIVDQVGEDLLQRQPVADDIRQRLDANLRFGLGRLMRDGGGDPFDQLPCFNPLRLEFPPSLAREVEDGRDQPVHFRNRGFDEAERFAKIHRKLLVGGVENRFGAVGRILGRLRPAMQRGREAAMRLKMSPRNSSSSLVKPMMFTSGERRSWLTI